MELPMITHLAFPLLQLPIITHLAFPLLLLPGRCPVELELVRDRQLAAHVGPHARHRHVEVAVKAVKVRDGAQGLGLVLLVPAAIDDSQRGSTGEKRGRVR